MYAQLNTTSSFSFLAGASHPNEYAEKAIQLGYRALAITDECSLAGVVKAYQVYKDYKRRCADFGAREQFKLIVGSRFLLSNGLQVIVLAPSREAYAELSGFITLTRKRSPKGEYEAHLSDLQFRLRHCLIILYGDILLDLSSKEVVGAADTLISAFKERLWLGISRQFLGGEGSAHGPWFDLASKMNIPLVACDDVCMHTRDRKPLQDVLTAIKHNTSVDSLGSRLRSNAEAYLKPLSVLQNLYPRPLLQETCVIADRCDFCLSELRYQYPRILVPQSLTPIKHLRNLVDEGKHRRYPGGVPDYVEGILDRELSLIEELNYEYFFLTVYDIVQFAQKEEILYQGRGSAANSVVCYCLWITNISPDQINVLFERFISKERNEPPDIDVDFEHQRREEVIQYIYEKYDREHAAIAATVITYRSRSAIRDVGKAMGLDKMVIEHFSKSLAWWDRSKDLKKRIESAGLSEQSDLLLLFFDLVQEIIGFPRHLSQHVGGFIIAQDKVSDLVPLENASMEGRTVIQWDKEDLETMGLLKVDVLALGMLTALRKALSYVSVYNPSIAALEHIPNEDPDTYEMLCQGDSVGVFQVESRAQMSMLPRLRPRTFYDLVIEIAIIRPGPIQGDMVHPYLRRRNGEEEVSYYNEEIRGVLESTNGVPIFQEQAIRLSMVAAGFSGGEADELRRAMASWGKNGNLLQFEEKFVQGMLVKGYPLEFAHRLFEQIKGFGGYGFPESHSASFALLCYYSSWLKRHHPAAFYCALLNSQPMGFYSASQLIQDARRHSVTVLPVDINISCFENTLERVGDCGNTHYDWGIRLGFCRVKSLNKDRAKLIEEYRGQQSYVDLQDLLLRTRFTSEDLKCLAAADALKSLLGDRHKAHWKVSEIKPYNALLHKGEYTSSEHLSTPAPSVEKNVIDDYSSTGLTLRAHPMSILRQEYPFSRCKKYSDLPGMSHGRFVRVAGIVTGRQRPGTAKGTIFLTLEDETGNINVIVWKHTQDLYRQALLTSKLLLVKGVLEISREEKHPSYIVVHVVAGELIDYTPRLTESFNVKSRDFH